MRNIFLFVRRYVTFLFFLVLQGFSIYLIVHYNNYHKAVFSNTANQLTGKVDEQYNKVVSYLQLKKTNDSLAKANERMYNKLRADFQLPDTASRIVIDSIRIDSLEQHRKFTYFPAKVVYNSVALQNNFIVLGRGSGQQLKDGMGVVDANSSVVGVVTEVSKDYAVVMSLLHKDSHLEGMLKKGNQETGTLSWDGVTPNIISISRIPKSAKVAIGDTILSSGNSTSIPRGMLLGYVTEVVPEKGSSNFAIKLRSAVNFYNLQYVYAIDNKQQDAINEILEKAKQKVK